MAEVIPDFTEVFLRGIKRVPRYYEALCVARLNSCGGLWLIGGAVYRCIAQVLYGIPQHIADFDFIIEQ